MDYFGILPDVLIEDLVASRVIEASSALDHDQIQPASLDLRCGMRAFRVRASCLPSVSRSVRDHLDALCLHEIDLSKGAVLETGCVYIVELQESLHLPDSLYALANPKSSTGRLDIFTRVIGDHGPAFDHVLPGYHGALWLEVSPRTFPVLVRRGSRLSQIRFRRGPVHRLSAEDLTLIQKNHMLVDTPHPDVSGDAIAVSVDLSGASDHLLGYRAKRHSGVVDVDKRAALEVSDFWEPLYSRGRTDLILDPGEFYILASKEAVHVPPLFAAEMVPFDPLVGEFRVHYAGFFDPGFGHAAAGGHGARAVLEVRSREVPFILEDGQIVGRLVYEKMVQPPHHLYGLGRGSNYQAQGLKLSKHFKVAA